MKNQRLSILIVDDNKDFVHRMSGLLDEIEAVNRVHSAQDYDEACKHLSADSHDLILLDINLPGKNGISLLKKIKQASWRGDVVMLSNYSGEIYRDRCKRLGASFFLDKTSEFDKVSAIIKELPMN